MINIVFLLIFLILPVRSFASLSEEEMCKESNLNKCVTPHGVVLGQSEKIWAYSNCRGECVIKLENWVSAAEANTKEPIFSGLKWQCVEYARRWWILQFGLTFGDIPSANEIFSLKEATRLADSKKIPLKSHLNSSQVPPRVGDLLIYKKDTQGFPYGHVSVITSVNLNKGYIDVAEQNYFNKKWMNLSRYARRIHLELRNDYYTVYNVDSKSFSPKKDYTKEKDILLGWVSPEF